MADKNTPEAVGAYRDPNRKSSGSILPYVLGALALLGLLLLILWLAGFFGGDDEVERVPAVDETRQVENDPDVEIVPTDDTQVPATPAN